jgi:predicted nuclease with TOPRIM domain
MMTTNPLVLVETFIKRLHDGDIVISYGASEVMYRDPYPSTGPPLIPLSDALAKSITVYEANKLDIEHLVHYANACLGWINTVIARGFVQEGTGLFSKMRSYEEEYGRIALENKQLKEEKNELQKENERLEKLNEELHKTLGKFGKAGNISDVSK